MPDHLHWLMALREDVYLADVMQRIKSVTAHRIRKEPGQPGPIWQAGYHDRALRREESLRNVARYVVANPLRAGLIQRLGDYSLWDAVWL